MRDVNYVPLSDISAEVRVGLNSWFESGYDIDESVYLPKVRYLLKKLSLPIHSITADVIEVSNYKAKLPSNFYKLVSAMGCFERCEYEPANEFSPVEITQYTSTYKINNCEIVSCNRCETPECGDEVIEHLNIIQKVDEGRAYKYQDVKLLEISANTIPQCDSSCINFKVKSEDQIDIDRNFINTNFESGNIYLEYYTTLQDKEGNFLIPENEIIQNAFREIIKEAIFNYLLLNTSAPVGQLYAEQKTLSKEAVREAINLVKTPLYSDIINFAKYRKSIFQSYYNAVYNY